MPHEAKAFGGKAKAMGCKAKDFKAKKTLKIAVYLVYMFTYGWQHRRSGANCKLGITHR